MKLNELSRPGRAALLTSIVLVAILLLGLLAEGAVRMRAWIKYGHSGGVEDIYERDQATGLRIPVAGGNLGPIHINSLGFRGPEITVPKPSETLRIAFVGASTTFCSEVSSNELTWPHLVWQQIMRELPSVKLDYVNAAVPGYSVSTSTRNLKLRVAPLKPDIIVIYHATNDLSFNGRHLAVEQGLVLETEKRDQLWLSKYSLLSYLVEKNLTIKANEHKASDSTIKITSEFEKLEALFRTDLENLVSESRNLARLVVLVSFSNRLRRDQSEVEQVKAAETHLYYLPYFTIDGIFEGFERYNRTIRQVADATDSLLIEVESKIPGDSRHFIDSVHFTDTGSKAMAGLVANGLLQSVEFQRLTANQSARTK